MFYMRRVAFVITVLVFREYLWAQLAVQNFLSLAMSIYLQWFKPLESNFANNIETFNEVTTIVLTYFLLCFSDFVPEPETRSELGIHYNNTTFLNMAVHLYIMLRGSFLAVRLSCRKRRYNKLVKKAQENKEKALEDGKYLAQVKTTMENTNVVAKVKKTKKKKSARRTSEKKLPSIPE